MTKRKSIIATSILAFIMCLTLVLGVSLGATTLVAHAEEDKIAPQIVSIGGEIVDQVNNMVSLPAGVVGQPFVDKNGNNYKVAVTGSSPVTVTIKSAESGLYGCLPEGLSFNPETLEIYGTPTTSYSAVGVTVNAENKYGSTNILCWIAIYSQNDKPQITTASIEKAYVGSFYSQEIRFSGVKQSYSAQLSGNVPNGLSISNNGAYATIKGTPTQAGSYTFTVTIDNGIGVDSKEYTLEVADEVIAPKIITKIVQTPENPLGVRALVGTKFELKLEASGTNTTENPLEFFLHDASNNKKTPNANGEYEIGNGFFLKRDGTIYNDNVSVIGTQAEGTIEGVEFYIGATNVNSTGSTGRTVFGGYSCIFVVNGYYVDEIVVTPENTDIPRGGKRQFIANVIGTGVTNDVTWEIEGSTTDPNTKIDQSGLLTVGANETYTNFYVSAHYKGIVGSVRPNIIDHTHLTHLVEAVAKTCETDGNIEHFKCDSCGGMFSDAKAINTLTEEQVVIKKGHEYGNLTPEVPATCSATGTEAYYECGVCHKLFDESKNEKTAEQLVIAIDSSAHNYGSMIDEVAATCASEGTKEHKDCLLCGKHFDNANNEITDLSLAKNDSHDLETIWTKAADGHYHKCKREGCKDNGKVDFAAHAPDRSEATEENAVKCTECGYIIAPALGHTHNLTLVPGKAATCQADGKKAYYTCDGCSEKFEDEAGTIAITADIETWGIIPKAHKFGQWINEVPATKEATGTKAHKDCEFCGKHFDNDGNEITDLTIAKLPSGGDQPGGEDNPGGEVIEPKQEGLSGGAIAGIVIGSVAVVGIGGFAFLWFAIKKKSFAELIAAIKGIFKKK